MQCTCTCYVVCSIHCPYHEANNLHLYSCKQDHQERLTLHQTFTCQEDREWFTTMTGLPSVDVFNVLLQLSGKKKIAYYDEWQPQSIGLREQLLMTLMRLRQNYPVIDLAHVSSSIIQYSFHIESGYRKSSTLCPSLNSIYIEGSSNLHLNLHLTAE